MRESAQFRLLFRTFFRRLFANELVPEGVDLSDALYWLVPMFAAPTAIVGLHLFPKYALIADIARDRFDVFSWPDKLFFLGYSMAAVGLLTVLTWNALFPDRRDAVVLGALPVRGRTIVAAKLAAVSSFLMGFAVVINLPAAATFSLAAAGTYGSLLSVSRYFVAHLLSAVGAASFIFLFLFALQTTLSLVLSSRLVRAAAVLAQLALVVLLIEWFLFSPSLLERVDPNWLSGTRSDLAAWTPPMWFLGAYEALLGTSRTGFFELARTSVLALSATLIVAVAAYALGYGRIARREITNEASVASPPSRGARWLTRLLDATLLRHSTERAVFGFVAKTLARSRRHRLLVAVYVGLGMAFVVAGFLGPWLRGETIGVSEPTARLLSIPLILSFFILVALRVLFAVPSELGAHWMFQMTESEAKEGYLRGIQRAMLLVGLLPIAAVTLPMYGLWWGFALAFAHTVFWLLLGIVLIEALLAGFHKIPFTCPYVPGKANVKLLWPVYLFAMLAYAYGSARVELWILGDLTRGAVACGVLLAAGLAGSLGRRWRRRRSPFLFDDAMEPTVQVLDLSR